MRQKILVVAFIALLLAVIFLILTVVQRKPVVIESFEQCLAAGGMIIESELLPPQCVTDDGRTFTKGGRAGTIEIPGDISDEVPGVDYPPADGTCVVAGCSGQLCIDATAGGGFTTCEMRPEYACFRGAICERAADGSCGWRHTPELEACLAGSNEPIVF